ncbi:hypothetical protein [Aminobacter sp. MSH1]|uniref:hypothetical protein n=1 Tax=Aminobacter sp. MSH1 TaxID=374606 RepID=UPI00131F0425|nr:hypothetical protein [Aminobacter sp. MSH1]
MHSPPLGAYGWARPDYVRRSSPPLLQARPPFSGQDGTSLCLLAYSFHPRYVRVNPDYPFFCTGVQIDTTCLKSFVFLTYGGHVSGDAAYLMGKLCTAVQLSVSEQSAQQKAHPGTAQRPILGGL